MKALLSLLVLALTTAPADARPVRAWTYQELFDASDTVLIATATKSQPLVDFISPVGYTGPIEAYQVDFTVLGVFKGDQKKEAKLTFYRLPTSGVPVPNGPGFIDIDTKPNNSYLLFLKDGRPVSGDIDPILSIRKIEPHRTAP
jgi:hypothetical protein